MTGTVYLVGAGPGAADLLTLRAARLLERADVLFHDALVSREVLALASRAAKVEVGKRSGKLSTAQHFINKRLVDAARKHEVVVRLKGGDPLLFGRAHEEMAFLKENGIAFEIVPGVTAALAAAAELRTSLTRRGLSRSVAFLTTRAAPGEAPNDWLRTAVAADTVAIYMGAGEADSIRRDLLAAGKPAATPVAVVENASLPEASFDFGTLDRLPEIAARGSGGPSLILLGEVFADAAIIRAWPSARSSSLPTAPVIPIGRGRSGALR
ncbi:MAG TPA: uroporphyrinogen-III C-methyltransferase [Burkholderiales bacterium]|jgi:uroporphyrin-III C-methyltransferase|nr:uroporphyrinogen-III C-methyltransferase [Burkholderiales bacterium]